MYRRAVIRTAKRASVMRNEGAKVGRFSRPGRDRPSVALGTQRADEHRTGSRAPELDVIGPNHQPPRLPFGELGSRHHKPAHAQGAPLDNAIKDVHITNKARHDLGRSPVKDL